MLTRSDFPVDAGPALDPDCLAAGFGTLPIAAAYVPRDHDAGKIPAIRQVATADPSVRTAPPIGPTDKMGPFDQALHLDLGALSGRRAQLGAIKRSKANGMSRSIQSDRLSFLPGARGCIGENLRTQPVVEVGENRPGARDARHEMCHLGAIGSLVSFKEEVLRRGPAETARICKLDRVFQHVVGTQHALLAMHLDALIVAIAGAARIRDIFIQRSRPQQRASRCCASP